MKVKVSELTEAALDWAVGKCQPLPDHGQRFVEDGYHPSTDWAQGGPIIDRECIGVTPITVTVGDDRGKHKWFANHEDKADFQDGSTPLIAAMRCFVASKLGDEVDVPDELIKGEQA